ncbi:Short-chain dehydrogenase [Candidatus Hydrogenisulfobacillus filiaventi]|uniref:Short-chain dehydrogenase n=1 Tax=Candidatus Hydrogenisulfobacillus filiaventi TaxID=2707344 RepID=A0A6F8ZJS2_9FIRM|nr:SDR family oxidoreductase [Bacillota bacterium]CAB1130239.1 Short-chain dehydrogenase [Candidatus Hydrogenisulfobacillus filiaventi]
MSLKGRVALVTGASRGIGAATARLLAADGARVVVNYLQRADAAEAVVQAIRTAGGEAVAVAADVRDEAAVAGLLARARDAFGADPDILVANAGMSFPVKPLAELSWDDLWHKVHDELKAAYTVSRAVLPAMAARGWGRVVYIASGLARRAQPGMAAHGTAKAALVQFARYVAVEYGRFGITANIISPGLVETEASAAVQTPESRARIAAATPLGRIATPEDVARAVRLYVGDDCGFITGSYVPVSGGASMD